MPVSTGHCITSLIQHRHLCKTDIHQGLRRQGLLPLQADWADTNLHNVIYECSIVMKLLLHAPVPKLEGVLPERKPKR